MKEEREEKKWIQLQLINLQEKQDLAQLNLSMKGIGEYGPAYRRWHLESENIK